MVLSITLKSNPDSVCVLPVQFRIMRVIIHLKLRAAEESPSLDSAYTGKV